MFCFLFQQVIAPETRAKAKLCLRENMQTSLKEFLKRYENSLDKLNNLLNERFSKEGSTKKKKKNKIKNKAKKTNAIKETKGKKAVRDKMSVSDADSIPRLVPIKNFDDSSSGPSDLDDNSMDYLNKIVDSEKIKNVHTDEGFSDSESSSNEQPNEVNMEDPSETDNRPNVIKMVTKKKDQGSFKNVSDQDLDKKKLKHEYTKLEQKNVDPFFKKKDDSEYLSYCDVKSHLNENHDSLHVGKRTNFESRKISRYPVQSFSTGFDKGYTRDRDSKKRPFNKDFNNRKGFVGRNFNKEHNSKFLRREKDHSSFNPSLRMTPYRPNLKESSDRPFRENGNIPPSKKRNFGMDNKKTVVNSSFGDGKTNSDVKLHPSWEAKKKLNQAPVAFEGKKIKFDD